MAQLYQRMKLKLKKGILYLLSRLQLLFLIPILRLTEKKKEFVLI